MAKVQAELSCTGPGRPFKHLEGSDTDTASWTEQYDDDGYISHIMNKIRRFYLALSTNSAQQLATELEEQHGFHVIDLSEEVHWQHWIVAL